MKMHRSGPPSSPARRRRGAALLVCLFVLGVTTLLVLAVFDTETLQMTAIRRTLDYERATYLAGAAVHHACAEIEANPSWRTGISSTEFPPGSGYTYAATAVNGTGQQVIITGTGTAGTTTRTLQVTIDLGS
jgi:Tfp pilus assembly protein PilX